jgi:hypothetical protein
VLYKNIGDYSSELRSAGTSQYPESGIQQPVYSPTYDSTIIDLTTIDTTLYYQKYSFWQEVLISNRKFPIIGDVNGNGRIELYGFEKDYATDYTGVKAKELNAKGKFETVWSYENTTDARNIYDINNDNKLDLQFITEEVDTTIHWWIAKSKFFEKPTDTSLATNLAFEFQAEDSNTYQYNPRFEDLDGDLNADLMFLSAPARQYIGVYEYNPVSIRLDSVFSYNYLSIDTWMLGFAVGDFDEDAKSELFIGGIHGKIAGFESSGNDSYQLIWQGEVETNNAYMYAETNDIDKNGRKEFWIGGDAYYNGTPMTRLTCFEASGNNNYQVVAKVDLLGVFSFFAYNIKSVDIDKDGVDELIVCIDGNFLILKFNGSPDNHSYEVYYIKQNYLAFSGENSAYWGATMSDLDYDNKEEILIDMDHIKNSIGIRFFTSIYKPNNPVGINTEEIAVDKFRLDQNYPNPFNPQTTIKFEISKTAYTTIKVYNTLGKEITTLLDKEVSPGNYSINWEAKDSNGNTLPSGAYLIRLTADNYTKTLKAVLLK